MDTSACLTAFGRYSIVIRDTPWGEKSVTFKVNPNPALFADELVEPKPGMYRMAPGAAVGAHETP